MSNLKIKAQYVEGGLVSLVGLFILINSLQIRNNPIRLLDGVSTLIVFVTEARFLPLILSIMIILMGIKLATEKSEKDSYWDVRETLALMKRQWRIVVTFVITFAYVYLIGRVHFYLASFLFMAALIFFLRHKEIKSVKQFFAVLIITIVATIVTGVLVPMGLNLYLP